MLDLLTLVVVLALFFEDPARRKRLKQLLGWAQKRI